MKANFFKYVLVLAVALSGFSSFASVQAQEQTLTPGEIKDQEITEAYSSPDSDVFPTYLAEHPEIDVNSNAEGNTLVGNEFENSLMELAVYDFSNLLEFDNSCEKPGKIVAAQKKLTAIIKAGGKCAVLSWYPAVKAFESTFSQACKAPATF